MKKIKIFVDTAADMSEELRKEYDIDIINFLSVFDGESFVAGEELSNEDFYKKLAESENIPTTSQTPPAVMYEKLLNASKEADTVVYLTISSKASGQYGNAKMNAEMVLEENPAADIRIVDSQNFSVYIGEAAIRLRTLLNDGVDIDEAISKSLEVNDEYEAYLLVDTLKYLEKGGRITKTAAIVGGILDIKPVLSIRNGLVEPIDKVRGKKKLQNKLIELMRENPEFDEDAKEFFVIDSDKENGDKLEEALCEEFGIPNVKRRYSFGPIVGTHTGSGAFAVAFKKKR